MIGRTAVRVALIPAAIGVLAFGVAACRDKQVSPSASTQTHPKRIQQDFVDAGLVLSPATGKRDYRFPVVSDAAAAVGDGFGGFYLVAQSFGGIDVTGLARIRANGSLDSRPRLQILGSNAFGPAFQTVSVVRAGATLYLAGAFSSIGGKRRQGLAAVDARSGAVLPWAPVLRSPGFPWVLAVAGSNVIVGSGGRLEAIDRRTGQASWTLGIDLLRPRRVGSVAPAIVLGKRLLVGGGFDRLRGPGRGEVVTFGPDRTLVQLDARTGHVQTWRSRGSLGRAVRSLAASGGTLFVGGDEGGYRVDLASGRVLGRLVPEGSVVVVAVGGGRLYFGSGGRDNFDCLGVALRDCGLHGKLRRNNLASVVQSTGRPTFFNPKLAPIQQVTQIVVSGEHVMVLGDFVHSLG